MGKEKFTKRADRYITKNKRKITSILIIWSFINLIYLISTWGYEWITMFDYGEKADFYPFGGIATPWDNLIDHGFKGVISYLKEMRMYVKCQYDIPEFLFYGIGPWLAFYIIPYLAKDQPN
jgi:hypothetical protein